MIQQEFFSINNLASTVTCNFSVKKKKKMSQLKLYQSDAVKAQMLSQESSTILSNRICRARCFKVRLGRHVWHKVIDILVATFAPYVYCVMLVVEGMFSRAPGHGLRHSLMSLIYSWRITANPEAKEYNKFLSS